MTSHNPRIFEHPLRFMDTPLYETLPSLTRPRYAVKTLIAASPLFSGDQEYNEAGPESIR
jgi:hypothetical protein